MVGCTWFSNFVYNVDNELGNRSDYSQAYLSGWFLDPSNLGLINAQIDSCYQLTGYFDESGNMTGICITPEMGNEELALYKANFDVFFYGREAKLSLSGSYGALNSWTTLKEGDTQVSQLNRSELARTFNMFAKDARASLKDLVKDYLRNKNRPSAVYGDDTVSANFYNGYYSRDWRVRW